MRVDVLQEFECVVEGVDGECVNCTMHDLTDRSCSSEFAMFRRSSFSDAQLESLGEGTVFYWKLGIETDDMGQECRFSSFVFPPPVVLSESELEEIKAKAAELHRIFNSEANPC